MKALSKTLLLLLTLLALVAVGCGDDDTDNGTDTMTTSDTTATDTTTTTDTTTATDTTDDTVTPTGACTNAADQAILADTNVDASASASTCGQGACLADADPATCVATCVADDTGLSVECSGCYGGTVFCVIQNCLTECLGASDSPECAACMTGTNTAGINCLDVFDACSGIPRTP